jgi:hypothetical protein
LPFTRDEFSECAKRFEFQWGLIRIVIGQTVKIVESVSSLATPEELEQICDLAMPCRRP